jgi:tetratricopeptide (TPR) repeat protein/nucleoside phosphorylase
MSDENTEPVRRNSLSTVVVCTALDVEYDAVHAKLDGPFVEHEERGTLYEIGTYSTDYGRWKVALTQTAPGNTSAAAQLERAVTRFHPQIVLFVGVAGGLKDVALGDVVIADFVYDYESGKDTATDFLPRIKTAAPSYRLLERAKKVARQNQWQKRIRATTRDTEPRAIVKPIAAGGKVVGDPRSPIATFLRQHCSDAVAVEMEGHGFLHGAYINADVEALVIRGISDLLSGKADDADRHWQPIAADHAAAFAFELLANVPPMPTAHSVPRQLPPRRRGFTGRSEQLEALLELLDPGADVDAVVVSAVAGLAGVGKTALALEAARIAIERGWFPGGDLFLDLHGYGEKPITGEQALGELLRSLGVADDKIRPDAQARANQFRSILANWTAPILIVADNASNVAQVRPLLPADHRHRVLITSRHTLPQLDARLLDVPVLTPRESIELMTVALSTHNPRDTRLANEPAAAQDVARLCGYLPLALRIAAALLAATPNKPIAELAEELADQHHRLDRLNDQVDSVRVVFDLSYQGLSDDEAHMFRLAALNPGPDFSTGTAAALADADKTRTRHVLDELARAHLLEPGSVRGRWSMHDLIRDYAAQAARTDEDPADYDDARYRLLEHYLHDAQAADRQLAGDAKPDDDAASRFAVEGSSTDKAEATSWFDAERANLLAVAGTAAIIGRDASARDLAVSLGRYLVMHGRFTDKLQVDTIRRDATLQLGDRHGLANAVDDIGFDLTNLHQFDEAVTTLKHACVLYREIGDRYGEGVALNQLGTALRGAQRFDESINACKQAAELLPQSVHTSMPRKGPLLFPGPFGNLFKTFLAAGRETEAAQLWPSLADTDPETLAPSGAFLIGRITVESERQGTLEAQLKKARKDGDRHNEGTALIGLSQLQVGQMWPENTLSLGLDAATIFRELGDHANESAAGIVIGRSLNALRRFDEAVVALKGAADLARQAGDRRGEANALVKLDNSLTALKRFAEATQAAEKAASIFHEVGDPRGEGHALSDLGYCHLNSGNAAASIEAGRRAVALCRETGQRRIEAKSLLTLGRAQLRMKLFEETVTTCQQAVTLMRAIETPVPMAEANACLAQALLNLKRYPESIKAGRQALAVFDETDEHAVRAAVLRNLAIALTGASRYEEALDAEQQAALAYRQLGDLYNEGVVQVEVVNDLLRQKRWEDVLDPARRAAAIFKQTGDNKAEGEAVFNVAAALISLGRLEQSIPVYRRYLAICQETNDRGNECAAMVFLGGVLVDTGQRREAITVLTQAVELCSEVGNREYEAMAQQFLRNANP